MSEAIEDGVDAGFAALLHDAAASVDAAIERDGGAPDFAAVVALASRLDPERVGAEAVAEAAALAPVVPLRHGRRARTRDDPELSAIVDEVRAHVDQCVASALSPAAPVAAFARRTTSRRVWGGVLAAAATLLLVAFGVVKAAELFERDEVERHDAAQHEQAHEPEQGSRARVIEQPTPSSDSATSTRTDASAQPPVEIVPAPPDDASPARRERAKRKRPATPTPEAVPAPPVEPTLDDQLAALDREAHAAWRAGDRTTAQSKFRRIVELAGTRRIADLAYGDLFTLARQGGKDGVEAPLWREYLSRFPGGRFADDARAGLCRRAPADNARACWEDYLRDFPDGSFRGQAERALEEPRP